MLLEADDDDDPLLTNPVIPARQETGVSEGASVGASRGPSDDPDSASACKKIKVDPQNIPEGYDRSGFHIGDMLRFLWDLAYRADTNFVKEVRGWMLGLEDGETPSQDEINDSGSVPTPCSHIQGMDKKTPKGTCFANLWIPILKWRKGPG